VVTFSGETRTFSGQGFGSILNLLVLHKNTSE